MEAAVNPSSLRMHRLEVHCDAFDTEGGRRVCRECRPGPRNSTEHRSNAGSERPRAIEMEDVHQLVSDHQLQPIVKVGEGEAAKRRLCANDNPIRGKDVGNSTGKVRVIGKKQVDPT